MTGDADAAVAVLVVLTVLVVLAVLAGGGRGAEGPRRDGFAGWGGREGPDLAAGYPYSYAEAEASGPGATANKMYSTAEVDPLITGRLFAGPRAAGAGRRAIYGGRTSHGDKWGMHEYSTGVPGQAGVDVGLLGMREYSLDGRPDVFDDGIPENWQMPSTPINWYAPQGRDYYDVEAQGAAVFKDNLMPLQEPDHEPLMN